MRTKLEDVKRISNRVEGKPLDAYFTGTGTEKSVERIHVHTMILHWLQARHPCAEGDIVTMANGCRQEMRRVVGFLAL